MSATRVSGQHIRLCESIGAVLTPDLLSGRWRNAFEETGNRYAGHCYAAAEALFHLPGGRPEGWVPCVMSSRSWPSELDEGETHWFVRNERTGEVLDPTAGQFDCPVPYEVGKGCGFLTSGPSRRARAIIERLSETWPPARTSLAA